MVMQRLHQNDPTGYLLKIRKDQIKHICLPGEIKNYARLVNPPELIDFYSPEGLLDPVRLSWRALNDFNLHGQYTYGSQIGQDPIPLGGGMFKVDNVSVVLHPPQPHEIQELVRYWDKAATEGGDGAFTAGVKMAKLKDKSFIVLDVKRGRWSTEKREQIIRQTAEADGRRCRIGIEQEPGSGGKESADATIKNLSGYMAHKDRPTGDKAQRADPYSVQVNVGNVKILQGAWNADYLEELKNFPQSTYKDQTDASSGAFATLTKRKQASVGRP
jgi:predicted phage terminase large subunit-like protein